MSTGLFVLGLALLAVVIGDALWTTIMPSGGGPWTSLLARWMWTLAKLLPRAARKRLLPLMGGFMLLAIIFSWLVMLSVGWWVLFSSDPGSVMNAENHLPADALERVYFVGFTIFTLGIGDFVPVGHGWQIATSFASLTGFFMVTLSITYLIPVLSAATQKRQLAGMIRDLGSEPLEMLVSHWDGEGFGALMNRINSSIWPMMHLHAQRHLAYPVLHYFRAKEAEKSLAVTVAVLDEALMILEYGVSRDVRPAMPELELGRRSITNLLTLLQRDFIRVVDRVPPTPSLGRLQEEGIPLDHEHSFTTAVGQLSERRKRVHGYVKDAGWEWEVVYGKDSGLG